jgi:hypothetical protein
MTSENRKTYGPYSNISTKPRSHWYGKETMCVYDAEGVQLCVVPRIYHYDRDGKIAKALSKAISDVLNKVGFVFNPETLQYDITPVLYPEMRSNTI